MLQEVNKIFSGANKYFLPGHASELVEHGDGVVAGGGRAPVRLPDLAHVGHDVAGVGAHHRHAAPAVLQLQVGGPEVSMVTACHDGNQCSPHYHCITKALLAAYTESSGPPSAEKELMLITAPLRLLRRKYSYKDSFLC